MTCNAVDSISSQGADGVAKAIDNLFESDKDLISETHLAYPFPNLLDWIHLRRIWWNMKQYNVLWDFKCF